MADNDTIQWTPELRAEMDAMTSTQRAAVLMLLLGEEQAAEIVKYLSPKEVQALGAAMVQASSLSQNAVNVVLDQFVDMLKKQNSVGLGGSDYVDRVMRLALGEDKANSVLNRIMPGQGTKGLDILSWMDPRSIAEMIRTEHPQVIAIILSILDTSVAADVLAELEQIMKQQFAKSSSSKSSSFGGIKAAAAIMNKTKTDLERSVMDGLEELDVELMLKIQDQMFTFDNLVTVDNKGIQVLMRNVEPDQLMVALKGAPEEVLARFLDNMSERARGMFKDDMDARGPVRVADVEDAQKKIMRLARKLSDTGELILGGADFV
jgi:flagellar motor switch protein FliG